MWKISDNRGKTWHDTVYLQSHFDAFFSEHKREDFEEHYQTRMDPTSLTSIVLIHIVSQKKETYTGVVEWHEGKNMMIEFDLNDPFKA